MTQTGWSTGKLTAALFPFGAGAMALNVYFGSLILSWLGIPIIAPVAAILVALPLGLPATWLFARHIRRLMDQSKPD
ncbi:MAG: NnrT protein [Paracoccaceae bacterium]